MSVNPGDEPQPFLEGEVARQWYASRHDRAQVLDDHAEVIYQQFGDADLRFRAAVDIRTGRPSLLIISISAPVDDAAAWERLVAVQEQLLEREAAMRERTGRRQPLGNIIVTLGESLPESASNLIDGLSEDQ